MQAKSFGRPDPGGGGEGLVLRPEHASEGAEAGAEGAGIHAVEPLDGGEAVGELGDVVLLDAFLDEVGRLALIRLQGLKVASGFREGPGADKGERVEGARVVELADATLDVLGVDEAEERAEAKGALESAHARVDVLRLLQVVPQGEEERCGGAANQEVGHEILTLTPVHVTQLPQRRVLPLPP